MYKNFYLYFGLNIYHGCLRTQAIKITEILKIIESDKSYVMPNKNNTYNRKTLREFLNYCNSAYGAAQILFSERDYSYNILHYPRETAKFANLFLTDSTKKYNLVMPDDFPISIFTDTILLKMFPIEFVIEKMIINKEQIAIKFDKNTSKFYLEKFDSYTSSYQTCLSLTISNLERAAINNRLNEIYNLYLKKDA